MSVALVTILIITTVFFVSNNKGNHQSNYQLKSIATAVMFDNVEDLYKSSDLVVKGVLLKDFDRVERKLTNKVVTEQLYTVVITEVVANTSENTFSEGDELKVSYATHFTTSNNEKYNLVDKPSESFQPGNYLLFLNELPEGIKEFTPISPNHIYKEVDKNNYINLISGTELNEIGKKEMNVMDSLR